MAKIKYNKGKEGYTDREITHIFSAKSVDAPSFVPVQPISRHERVYLMRRSRPVAVEKSIDKKVEF